MPLQIKEIERFYSASCNLVLQNRLKEALQQLHALMEGMHVADFTMQYEDIDQTYRMLLEYNFRGVPDPQRDAIFGRLKLSLLELADKVRQQALALTGMHIYQLKTRIEKEKEWAKEEAARKIDSHTFELEFANLLQDIDLRPENAEVQSPSVSPKLFQLMWLTDKYTDTDLQLVQAIRNSKSLSWHEKCLAVSAITLSLINCFDKEKFGVLFDFYEQGEPQVWQRAFAGLVVATLIYDKRLELYPAIRQRYEQYVDNEDFIYNLNSLLIQVLKARETENLTRKFHEEILPDVQKMESKIREKLDLDNLINNELIEDKNPDWEHIFEDSPDLLSKIEKMSEMQMDGLDLFMGTFAMLKNFDFFKEISNWFRPFYKENEDALASINDAYEGKIDFLAGLEDSFYMCNSDKYSFCFNLHYLPEEQSRNVMSLFNMEAEAIREQKAEDGLLNKKELERYVFTQYIQDIYRFFKLHPFRNDFRDIFNIQWNIAESWLLNKLKNNTLVVRANAEFLFGKEHYAEAAQLFDILAVHAEPDISVFEKLAYCYQMTGRYRKALEFYHKAEILDTNRLWNLKKIVFCYRKLGDNEQALKWALEASALAPDDAYLHTMLGNCYIDSQEYEKALKHYFKVEMTSADSQKVWRPIAWCCFVLGKLDKSRNYLSQIIAGEPKANDFVNLGHVELCSGNKPKAIESYLAALSQPDYSIDKLSESILFDRQFLITNGIDANEINLITDYLRFR